MSADAVPCTSAVTVTASGPLRHLCPFKDEVDVGTIKLTWTVQTQTVELHSLAAWLEEFSTLRISHEDLTDEIARHLADTPGLTGAQVTTTWNTAGMTVTCASNDAVLRKSIRG